MDYKSRITTGLVLVLGFLIGLGSGLLVNSNQVSPIIIDKNIKIGLPIMQPDLSARQTEFSQNLTNSLNFVASINGKAYYPKNCKAANVIKEENRVWFTSAEEAEDQGYAPAKNCP